MKYLALAVLLVAIQTPAPVPRKTAHPNNGTPQNAKQGADSIKAPSPQQPPLAQSISPEPSQNANKSPAAEDKPKTIIVRELPPVSVAKDSLDKIYIAFTGLLIIVGILGAKAAFRTLKAIETQTQALVNSERAQVYVKAIKHPGSGGHATFRIRAKNYGGVPARIISSVYTETALQFPDRELPTPPQYDRSILLNEKFLEPRAKHIIVEFDPFSEPNRMRQLSPPGSKAVVYGRIEYFDGISLTKRETRFAFAHVKEKASEIGGQLIRCGSREYNLYT